MSVYSHQFFDQQSAGSLASAHVVLKALFDIASFESVVDVGCGVAPWLRAAKDFGVNYVVGLDGDYVDRKCLLVEPVCFRPCDLEAEDLRRVVGDDGPFDLAICMEVAEHLSAGRAPAFVRELCSLSDFVLFSAAIPGQGGTNHVNEQWPEYWAAMFANNSFVCFDVLRPCLWSREECKWWYIQNVLLFAKRDTKASEIAARLGPPVASPMPLVHPRTLSGRDARIRALEAEVDRLRTIVLEKSNEAELLNSSLERVRVELAALRSERDQPAQENAAIRASTSWRITGPLRRAVTLLRR
jgi:SAM-dependent methyltransferase